MHNIATADIANVDYDAIANVGNIGEIAAIFWDHTINKDNSGTERHETPGQGGADQAQTTGDYHTSAFKNVEPQIGP
jgi:hypothetical protein